MEKNIGKTDRIIRAVLAILLAYLSYTYLQGAWMYVLYILAIILLVTSATGFCYPYKLLGINTNK